MTFDRRAALAALMLAFVAAAGHAQSFPTKPITIVVPFAPGGVADVVARAVAQRLSTQMGKPVVVENKAGAGGAIATDFVARATPDGHTLLIVTDSHTIAPALGAKLNSDPIKDFAPVSLFALGSHVIVAHPSLPASTVKELIEYTKQHPGEPYASTGNGSAQHLGMEQFKSMAGIDLRHVPYKGGGQAITDLLGGQVKVGVIGLGPVLQHVKSGKLKAVAVTGEKRSSVLPNVPTVMESGLPGFSTLQWFGFVAPAGTPAEVIKVLHAELLKASQDATVIERLTAVDDLGTYGDLWREQESKLAAVRNRRRADLMNEIVALSHGEPASPKVPEAPEARRLGLLARIFGH